MAYDVAQLLRMTQKELDDLFTASEAGPIPDGEADGAVIIKPGTALSPEIEIPPYFCLEREGFRLQGGTFGKSH